MSEPARLTDMMLLAEQVEEITAGDFRKRIGDVLLQVQMGKTFTITKNGRPIAMLAKVEPK